MRDRNKVFVTEAEKDAEIERLNRVIERQTKRAQRGKAKLANAVRPVQSNGQSTEKLDLKQLTDLQIRHAVEMGNTPALIAVFKELRESPTNVLSEQDWMAVERDRKYRGMTAEQLRARIRERQDTLKQADGEFYQLPPTVSVVPKDDVGDISDPAFFADMQRVLTDELDGDSRDAVVQLRRSPELTHVCSPDLTHPKKQAYAGWSQPFASRQILFL